MTVRRADLARFMRFGSRIATHSTVATLRSVRFSDEGVAATDLDLWLSAKLPGARDIGVLVPAVALKQALRAKETPDLNIERIPGSPSNPLKVSIDGAIFSGHDPREFPDVDGLLADEQPVARARFGSLEAVLVAASTDDTRRSFRAVFCQLCRNLAVATNGHRLHTLRENGLLGLIRLDEEFTSFNFT
jgi:hypothetical protein